MYEIENPPTSNTEIKHEDSFAKQRLQQQSGPVGPKRLTYSHKLAQGALHEDLRVSPVP